MGWGEVVWCGVGWGGVRWGGGEREKDVHLDVYILQLEHGGRIMFTLKALGSVAQLG